MKRLLLVLALASASAPSARAQRSAAVAPELERISIDFAAAFNEGNVTKLATFYADDGVLMPPGGAMARGRAAIQAAFQQQIAQGVKGLRLIALEARVAGGQAFEAGTSSMTIGTGPKTVAGHGKYVVVYRRVGGRWKIAYDIFNADAP